MTVNWNVLESSSIESERLVQASTSGDSSILSRAGHEESGGKPGGPPSKPKYDMVTDSA